MAKVRYTKQGVRDLNPVGWNGRGTRPNREEPECFHVWEWQNGEERYRCLGCREIRQ